MNRANLLQETAAWMDTVDLALCLFIYEVCNDYQFEYLSGSDFVNFLYTEICAIIRYKSMQKKNDKNIKTTILDEIEGVQSTVPFESGAKVP